MAYVAQRREAARLLVIGTYRPAEVIVSEHPLRAVKQDLQGRGLSAELALGMLPQVAVSQYLAARFPQQQFPQALSQFLYRSTEGNPLFIVNIVDYLIAQGLLREVEGHWRLRVTPEELRVSIPESVRQLIARQLERLSDEEQRVLEVASVAGAEFSALAVVAGVEEGIEHVEARCEGLVRRGHFLQASEMEAISEGTLTGRYSFLHALYRSVVYERVGASQRVRLHRRIGERLEAAYGPRAGELAAELAVHFEQGRDYRRAVQYLQRAAQNALQRSANVEAIQHLTKALELLKTLPDAPERAQQELRLQTSLGGVMTATRGWADPETGAVYARARELCRQVGETPQIFPVLWGLCAFYSVRAEYQIALELAEQLLSLAESAQDAALLLAAHYAVEQALNLMGEYPSAREH